MDRSTIFAVGLMRTHGTQFATLAVCLLALGVVDGFIERGVSVANAGAVVLALVCLALWGVANEDARKFVSLFADLKD